VVTLGLGVAGGANLHRLVDMGQTTTWLQQMASILQSGLEAAGTKIGSFTSRPVSVAQASQEATSSATLNNGEAIEQAIADLRLRVEQLRAANDGSARDLRSAVEQNHRELTIARLLRRARNDGPEAHTGFFDCWCGSERHSGRAFSWL